MSSEGIFGDSWDPSVGVIEMNTPRMLDGPTITILIGIALGLVALGSLFVGPK